VSRDGLQCRGPTRAALAVISTAVPIQPLDCAELIRGRAGRERLTLTGMQLRLLPDSDSTDAQTCRTFTLEQDTLKWQAESTTKPERLLDRVSTGLDSLLLAKKGQWPPGDLRPRPQDFEKLRELLFGYVSYSYSIHLRPHPMGNSESIDSLGKTLRSSAEGLS
jgi:hypothetical protein